MNESVRDLLLELIQRSADGKTPTDAEQKQLSEHLLTVFDNWFAGAEGQAPLASFEKALIKTTFAWLIARIFDK